MIVLTIVSSIVMLIPDWNGPQGSAEADDIDTLLDVMIVLSCFVFSVVVVMLGYCLIKFRAKPGDESDGKPVHGNTKLEIAWTVIPTVIVLFGAALLVDRPRRHRDRGRRPAADQRSTAQQYKWTFEYSGRGRHLHELHVPVDQQLELNLVALDVLHSFWVPEWRLKRDLVPIAEGNPSDVDNVMRVTPDREGTFQLICTELCGLGHATMRATVVVESRGGLRGMDRRAEGGAGGDRRRGRGPDRR